MAAGIDCGDREYLSVWCLTEGERRISLAGASARCLYPSSLPADFDFDAANGILTVRMAAKTARLFEIAR